MRGRVGRDPHPARSTRSSSRPRRAAAKPSRPPSRKAPRKGSKPRIKVEPPSVDQQPLEVVIKVKNKRSAPPKRTQQQAQPAPKRAAAASSGKVGKRKEKVKKEALKKAASADPRGLVDFVQVSVYTKVIPSPPVTEPSAQTKKPKGGKTPKKEKPEKKKPEKKEKETKTEPEVKTEKDNQPEKDAPPKKPSSTPKDGKIKKTVKEVKNEIKIKKEPPEEKEEKETIEEEDNEVIIDKVVTPEKKKKNKPKNVKNESKDGKQAPKKSEPKPKETTDQDKAKATKPKIKVESISPVTVKDEKESECSAPPSPVPEDTPGTSKQKKGKEKEEKVNKGRTQKKDAPKKKASKKPPPKPVIKEEPVFLEKRHREASLNALAKVHCLYENESRGAMNEILDKSIIKKKDVIKTEKVDPEEVPEKEEVEKSSRTLRSAPGMRGMGRYWDTTHLPTSSSSSSSSSPSSSSAEEEEKKEEEEEAPESSTEKPPEKKARKRRKRCEVRMDLKDMVVTKRMASLNASAMMAASYSVERRSSRGSRSEDSSNSSKESSDDEVVMSGASKKVAVIVNQDADLTITGLYTTRSTRHEGYCSIAGMQYRISSTSHTQTEATAVSSETLIHTTDHVSLSHSESGGSEHAGTSSPGGSLKSYTPLGALSSMQPPGQSRPSSSAFSAPPYHPHPQEIHGYYQPAGPLIQHAGKSATPEPPATYAPPPYPYPSPYPPEYSPYYSRGGYRRPWAPDPYLEPYPHPAAGYYHPYPAPPPPPPPPPPPTACYGSPVRAMPFIAPNIRQEPYDQGFQCPCPMQSACPKNVHTGPLTGASKGSEIEAPQTEARLPVALALPPESAISPGPPSPARGSVGMPPSSSPALSTARKERWSPPADIPDIKPSELTMEEEEETKPLVLAPTKRRAKRTPGEEQGRKRKKLTSTKHKTKGSKLAVLIEEKDEKNNNELLLDKVALRPPLKLSNGWSWEGEPFQAKVMRTTEDVGSYEKCYPAMRHAEGDVIRPRDCILLRSGQKKNLPFVAKVSAMWENPDDGEMMVSVLWYYRPEHTEAGPIPNQPPDEIFASRHKDTNSVACIEDKCYVLTYHEYARYRKSLVAGNVSKTPVVPPPPEGYPRRDLLPPGQVASELIFFCRQVYDFRQKKILKKPPSQLPLRT